MNISRHTFKHTGKLALSAAVFCLVSICFMVPAHAGENGFTSWDLFHGAPKFESNSGNYWKVRGRLMGDYSYSNESFDFDHDFFDNGDFAPFNRSYTNSEFEFRAARIGVEGKYGDFKFVSEVDFAGSSPTAKDVNISWDGPIKITVGQLKAGGSLEELTSARHTTFMERAMITDAVGFDRRLGVKLSLPGDNYGINVGVYRNSIDSEIDGRENNTVYAARAYYAHTFGEDNIVHIGTSFRHTVKSLNPRRSARWGPHTRGSFGRLRMGQNANLFGAELAAVMGPFHGHVEYIQENGDDTFISGKVKGGFVQAGYFITGETRAYKKGSGKFDRTKPLHPLSKGGWGGFEVAGRFDTYDYIIPSHHFDADQNPKGWTAGLTWYPESHLRLKINYTHASNRTDFFMNSNSFNGDGIYTRLQIDW